MAESTESTTFARFESEITYLRDLVASLAVSGRTSTTTMRTVETTNDTDSNSGIEGKAQTAIDVVGNDTGTDAKK